MTVLIDRDIELHHAVEQLEYRYARVLDAIELEAWVDLFAEECRYKILPRENYERGLPLGLINCDSKGMLRDRVRSLREANIYNIHHPRRMVGNVEILAARDGVLQVVANYTAYQTDAEGVTRLFSVGQYRDVIVVEAAALKFREKLVLLDTFSVPNLLAIPL
ncbi:MAG: aromatic-ring-hydroxylating dioxygenase subunit beta [Stellaceae bacterium]